MKHLTITTALLIVLAACQNKTQNQSNISNQNTMEQTTEKTAIEKVLFSYRHLILQT